MVRVSPVTFEHHREALGIGQSAPRLSWKSTGDEKNWTQSSYELKVTILGAGSKAQKSETFKVESSDSALVPWPCTPLNSRQSATVQVRVTGAKDSDPLKWSIPSTVEIGLLEKDDWRSRVIAAPRTLSTSDSLRPALFRKGFHLAKNVHSARLYITAYGVYEAFINATKVGDHVLAPGWTSYKYHHNYQTFDVTNLLQKGDNVIGVEAGEGWFSGRLGFGGGWRCIYGDKLAVLAQLEVAFDDGQVETIGSDQSWKTSTSAIIAAEIYDGESYDAREDISGWSSPSFKDESWGAVTELEFPAAILQAPEGPPVRKVEVLKPKSIFKTPAGKTVVDFGQNLVGWSRVQVSGPSGHKITFTHTEVLEHGEIATRPLRKCKAQDSLTLAGKAITWEPKFTFHGFRFVQIDNWPLGDPSMSDLVAIVIHTDMQRTGWFECSEPMVNQLHQNICWGMKGNFVSIPTDCPQRDERLGWTGDIQVFSPTANFLYDTFGMLSGWLKDLAVEQINELNGVVGVVVPNILPSSYTDPQAAWSDAAIITPWDLYTAVGDRQILKDQLESMKEWLEKGVARQENGLWNPDSNQLGDWLDPDAPPDDAGKAKTDPHLVANAYLVHVTDLMSKICVVLRLGDAARHYGGEARLRKLFQDEYITPNGRLAPDTMTSLSLAISFNLFSTPTQRTAASQRLSKIVRFSTFKISTGFVGTPLILPSLTTTSQSQLAYRMLLTTKCPSWLYPITMGATTMWERWDSMLPDGSINPGEMTSFNHYALGSVGAWLHATVGGISPKEPGWKVVRFEPVPGGTLKWARCWHESPYGDVRCEWRLEEGGKLYVKIKVPLNCTGEVKLPGREEVVNVGSGVYDFTVVGYDAGEWPPKALSSPFTIPEKDEFEGQ